VRESAARLGSPCENDAEEATRIRMSVHGEYSRALRHLIERLDEQASTAAARHRKALDGARPTPERDLSTAARTALAVLARVEAELVSSASATHGGPEDAGKKSADEPASDVLRDACHHLRAHCRAILGAAASGL
jgi:hypothetical protein